jgi:hypothetical protein
MQNIFQKERSMGRINRRRAEMMKWQTLTITHMDLLRTRILLMLKIQVVEVRGNVMSHSSIRIPIEIIGHGGSSNKRLHWLCWLSVFTLVSMIEAIVACQCCMTKLETDLTGGFGTITGWSWQKWRITTTTATV